MIGFALGFVIRSGASTGGMDIPPLVLQKRFKFPVSVSMYVFDVAILLSQLLFRDREKILYGIIMVMVYTVILDKMLMMGKSRYRRRSSARNTRRSTSRCRNSLTVEPHCSRSRAGI